MSTIDGKIYKITNLVNGKIYIGQTIVKLEKRWKQHTSPHCHKIKKISLIHLAIVKYGIDKFTFEQIDKANNYEELNRKEIEYIENYNSLVPNGYNLRKGGDQSSFSEITKSKMSESQKNADNKLGKHPRAKKVIDIVTGQIWECAKELSIEKNINYSTLRAILNGDNGNNTNYRYLGEEHKSKPYIGRGDIRNFTKNKIVSGAK